MGNPNWVGLQMQFIVLKEAKESILVRYKRIKLLILEFKENFESKNKIIRRILRGKKRRKHKEEEEERRRRKKERELTSICILAITSKG